MAVNRYNFSSHEEWRKERAKSIGASAIGILIGENHFTTPMQLAEKMKEELNGDFDFSQNLAMMRGHAYEQGVADLFSWTTGKEIIKNSSKEYLLRRDDIPFMHASPDRTYWIDENGKHNEANKGILECKTTRRPVDPDNPPLSWQFQLQVQMGIMGAKEGYLAWDVLSIADGFGFKRYDFDNEIFDAAVEICRDFWERNIMGDEIPDPINATDVIARYPSSVEGKTITATEDIAKHIDSIKEMQEAKSDLERMIAEEKDAIAKAFTDEEAIISPITGKPLVTFKTRKGSWKVDSKKLKTDYPDVYFEVASMGDDTRVMLIK